MKTLKRIYDSSQCILCILLECPQMYACILGISISAFIDKVLYNFRWQPMMRIWAFYHPDFSALCRMELQNLNRCWLQARRRRRAKLPTKQRRKLRKARGKMTYLYQQKKQELSRVLTHALSKIAGRELKTSEVLNSKPVMELDGGRAWKREAEGLTRLQMLYLLPGQDPSRLVWDF